MPNSNPLSVQFCTVYGYESRPHRSESKPNQIVCVATSNNGQNAPFRQSDKTLLGEFDAGGTLSILDQNSGRFGIGEQKLTDTDMSNFLPNQSIILQLKLWFEIAMDRGLEFGKEVEIEFYGRNSETVQPAYQQCAPIALKLAKAAHKATVKEQEALATK